MLWLSITFPCPLNKTPVVDMYLHIYVIYQCYTKDSSSPEADLMGYRGKNHIHPLLFR